MEDIDVYPKLKHYFPEKIEKVEYYKDPTEKTYEKYFETTVPLKLKSKFNNYIVNLLDEKDNVIGYKFLKKDLKPGYEEFFIWKDLELFSQLSKKISFIFPPQEGKNIDKIIGYRYYEEIPTKLNEEQKYFTLVLKKNKKYDILEKSSSIKDINGNSFIENDLNCYNIIIKIIQDKFKDEIIYEYPSSVIEVLGFYYSVLYKDMNINENIKFIEPFYPVINNRETMKEAINEKDISNDKLFIEPILFNKHVSVLYFKYKNGIRLNMLIDPSLFHCNIITNDKGIFPKTMRTLLSIFPRNSCQSGPSCSIWFISQIIVALNNGNSFFNEEYEFNYLNLLRIIECINNFIKIDINQLIYVIDENINSKSINISYDQRCFISHKIAFSSYLNIFSALNNFSFSGTYLDFYIDEIKNKFDKIRNFICNSKINKEYYEYLGEKSDITEEKINNMKQIFKELQKQYDNFVKLFLEAKDDPNNAFQLNSNINSLLDKTLENFHSIFMWNIYEKEEIKNFYKEKNNIFSSFVFLDN